MKLSLDSGTITCSLEDKNSLFLAECAGAFDGFLRGKLKLYDYVNYEGITEDGIIEGNAELIQSVVQIAQRYGVEVSEEVKEYGNILQERVKAINERERLLEEERERSEKWERLCKHGCGRCPNLTYYIDVPKCKQTGTTLKDKPVPKYVNGVMYLFNFVAFPSEDCPFNIKNKEYKNEHLREHYSSPGRR